MCANCNGTGYDKGVRCDICNEQPCVHTVAVEPYKTYNAYYVYQHNGKCPYCGGVVIIEDGHLVCVAPGTCTYSAEII